MLNFRVNEVEIELLEILGIELKDGKLVNVETGKEFVPVNSDKPYDRKYECGNDFVCFHIYKQDNGEIISLSVLVQKDDLWYEARNYHNNSSIDDKEYGRVLRINKIGKNNNEIIIEPQFYSKFMKTSLSNSKYTMDDITIDCSFDGIYVYSVGSYFYPCILSKENYEKVLYHRIEGSYGGAIKEAYHKCMPFLMKGYEKLEYYPVEYKEKFKDGFEGKIARINEEFVDGVKNLMTKKEEFIANGLQTLKDEGKDSTMNQIDIYYKAITEYETGIDKYMKRRDKEFDLIKESYNNFLDYVQSYEKTNKSNSK